MSNFSCESFLVGLEKIENVIQSNPFDFILDFEPYSGPLFIAPETSTTYAELIPSQLPASRGVLVSPFHCWE